MGRVCARIGVLSEVFDGGFVEVVTLPCSNVLRAPYGVADRRLAMAVPMALAFHAMRHQSASSMRFGGLVALFAAREGQKPAMIDRNDRRAALDTDATAGQVVAMEVIAQQGFHFAIYTTENDLVIVALV